jgi:branched-chain amino acid transport system substrate-binding protein
MAIPLLNNVIDRHAAGRKEKVVTKPRLGALAALLALAVTAAGFAGGVSNAASVADVKIGAICDLSGPTSDVGAGYCKGEVDYVAYFNSKGGFSNKAKVDMTAQDYAYNVARALQLYSQQSSGAVAFFGWGTADTSALTSRITADKLPFMSASLAEQLTDPKDTPYNFVVGTNYTAQAQIALKYIAKTKGHHEVAFFHNNSAFGTAPIAGAQDYIKDKKLDIGWKSYPMISGTTAFDAQLLQAQQQKADYILLQNVPTAPSILAKDVKRLGLKAKLVCLNYCSSEVFLKLAGSAAEGMIGVQPFTPVSYKVPGMKAPEAYLKAHGSTLAKEGLFYLQGWYTAALMLDSIDSLIKAKKDVTGPNIKAQLESQKAFLTGGVTFPIKFGSSGNVAHDGMKGSRIYTVKGGKFVKATGFVVP